MRQEWLFIGHDSAHELLAGRTWLDSWCEGEKTEAPWELWLELVNGGTNRWGYLSLIRMSNQNLLALNLNVLCIEFRCALTGAIERATTNLEKREKFGERGGDEKTRSIAAGTMAD